MAAAYFCDGCGSKVDNPKVVGSVLKRDYCVDCAKNAEMFLATEEAAREHTRRSFAATRQELIRIHGKDGKFKLPDVP